MTSYMTTEELGLAFDMLISSDGYIPRRKRLETIYQNMFSDRPTKDKKKGIMEDLEELYLDFIYYS